MRDQLLIVRVVDILVTIRHLHNLVSIDQDVVIGANIKIHFDFLLPKKHPKSSEPATFPYKMLHNV